jgi:hypothetical protein
VEARTNPHIYYYLLSPTAGKIMFLLSRHAFEQIANPRAGFCGSLAAAGQRLSRCRHQCDVPLALQVQKFKLQAPLAVAPGLRGASFFGHF